ncbi:MAG: transposase [Candidatus Levybacteria bacterium]|nr:transposase [Candidatus Levybacteria bacterium]
MPYRKTPLVAGEIYHVFSRSIAGIPIFRNIKDYQRMLDVIMYYRFEKPPLRFSHYNRLPFEQKEHVYKLLLNSQPMLEMLAYCIMPNHLHFLLQLLKKNSASNFMRNIQNSYAKYFNTKYHRTGSLFQFMFKAVIIENDDQLIHVSRYIHLNPVTAFIIEIDQLKDYPWSSFGDYISAKTESFTSTNVVLQHFKSVKHYKRFVFDQVDYQRELDQIKHLTLE